MIKRIVLAIMACIVVQGCGDAKLSRPEAQKLLQQELVKEKSSYVQIRHNGFEDGVKQGFWSSSNGWVRLSAKGATWFNKASKSNLNLSVPIRRIVTEVTGIQNATSGNVTRVEFKWEYVADDPVKRFIVRGGTGTATITKFDDGWRVRGFDTKDNSSGFSLNSEEQAAVDKDIADEELRIREEKALAIWQQQRMNQARVEVVSQLNALDANENVIRSYPCADSTRGKGSVESNIAITDVGIFYKCGGRTGRVWFGGIRGHRFNNGYRNIPLLEIDAVSFRTSSGKLSEQAGTNYAKLPFTDSKARTDFFIGFHAELEKWKSTRCSAVERVVKRYKVRC